MIPFNIPYTTGSEISYIKEAIKNGHLSGNGPFTKKCQKLLEEKYNINKCFLTTSCTDALEMATILAGIKPGDEVIIPSFTFVSTALAFSRQGAIIRFVDSKPDHPGVNENMIEMLINSKTKAIVTVHYAGIACDMESIINLAARNNLLVIEDNAHGVDSFYKGRPLGTIGHLGCFSFHDSKGIHCGEGGLLAVNDKRFTGRAEIIWEKGTNRAKFFRGEDSYYDWKDTGSSFLPSEINAAFLYAQLNEIDKIQRRRINIWRRYYNGFTELSLNGFVKLPFIPQYSTINGNTFFLECKDKLSRDGLIRFLGRKEIFALSHFRPLHKSEYFQPKHDGRVLEMSEKYSDTLIRLPLFFKLTEKQVDLIISNVCKFFKSL